MSDRMTEADRERYRIEAWLRRQATTRFATHGVMDARGAAWWDAANGLVEGTYTSSEFATMEVEPYPEVPLDQLTHFIPTTRGRRLVVDEPEYDYVEKAPREPWGVRFNRWGRWANRVFP